MVVVVVVVPVAVVVAEKGYCEGPPSLVMYQLLPFVALLVVAGRPLSHHPLVAFPTSLGS